VVERGHPIPLTEIKGTRNPDCRCLIPAGESRRRRIRPNLKNPSMNPFSGDDVTYKALKSYNLKG
jgi:hypothetical protein